MKIATWNVNSIRSRLSIVKNWLEINQIDVLCLQETKVIDQDFPKQDFEEIGYNVYIYGQKAYNGVAIFSKEELTNVKLGFTPVVGEEITGIFDEQKRVITGKINDIQIVNLYVPNGNSVDSDKYEYKLNWFKVLKSYLTTLKNEQENILVCGDFNIALEDIDIYTKKPKNHIMCSPVERETLTDILQEIELKDVFRKFNQDTGNYTWWDYRRGGFSNNRGWRIDHHYLTSKLYDQGKNCIIDLEPRKLEKPSDHTPVIVEI
jgi:exodeoxyribonuclease III